MQYDITKLCADSLRAFLNANYGIKLKSGHAHEITAAAFGYKSRIALLADSNHSMSCLGEAEFILLTPAIQLLNQRLQCLEGLPVDLPSIDVLVENIYSTVRSNGELSKKLQPSFREVAIQLANEPISRNLKALGLALSAFKWQLKVEIQEGVSDVVMNVSFDNLIGGGERQRYAKVDINLRRIAGNIGYGVQEVLPTFYSGRFHDPEFNPDVNLKTRR